MRNNLLIIVFIVFSISMSCEKNKTNEKEQLLTNGQWIYKGTYIKQEISQTMGDSLFNIPIDTKKYGIWTFYYDKSFKDQQSIDSVIYGKWYLKEDNNTLTINYDSASYEISISGQSITKDIKELSEKSMIFEIEQGLYMQEIFEHKN